MYMVQNILDYNYQMLRNIFNRHIVNISILLSLPLTWNIWIFVCVSKSNKAGLFEGSLSWGGMGSFHEVEYTRQLFLHIDISRRATPVLI